MKKRIMALALTISLIAAGMPVTSMAVNIKIASDNEETYVSEELGGTISGPLKKQELQQHLSLLMKERRIL